VTGLAFSKPAERNAVIPDMYGITAFSILGICFHTALWLEARGLQE